jgi:hypothetical protein
VEVVTHVFLMRLMRFHMTVMGMVNVMWRHVMRVMLRLMMLRVMLMGHMLVRSMWTVMTLGMMRLQMTVMTVFRHFNSP